MSDYEQMSLDQRIQYLLDGWLASTIKCNKALKLLRESRAPNKLSVREVSLCPESYEWMAEKVRGYSEMPNDFMALAADEFLKVAEVMEVLGDGKETMANTNTNRLEKL